MARWQQYHANGANQGFIPVHSTLSLQPKWTLEIGPVGYGAPVLGLDGTIYVATLKGELVAVDPNGSIKWRASLLSKPRSHDMATGSPAVGQNGNIYVITTLNLNIRDHRGGGTTFKKSRRSTLHCVTPAGALVWSSEFPANTSTNGLGGYTTASPKVWGNNRQFIFAQAIYETVGHAIELLVFNDSGVIVNRTDIASYPVEPLVGYGPSIGDILSSIWDFISSPVDFDTSGASNGKSLEEQFGRPEPTLAIVDFGDFSNEPLIIVEDNFKTLSAFRFNTTAAIPIPLWTKKSAQVRLRSTPAVFPNGILAIGEYGGTLVIYDVNDGSELWKPWYKANKPITAPAASFGRQIFFCATDKFIVLDANSELWQTAPLEGKSLAAPALSAAGCYVSSSAGLFAFSFDLQNFSKNADVKGGVSAPVIGDDGTIYVMDLKNNLWALGE